MRIIIEEIEHSQQRYPTVGDWQFDEEGNLNIKISSTGNPVYTSLLAVHELIEALYCRFSIIKVDQSEVDKWDIEHPDAKEPGELPGCPYFKHHRVASHVESGMADDLRVDWKEYEETLNNLG
jgi:hypothetical protein